jgi:hypothetical protein
MRALVSQSHQPTPCFNPPTLADVTWFNEAYEVGIPSFPADGPQFVQAPPYLIVRNPSPLPLYVLNPGAPPHPDWALFWKKEVGLPLTDNVAAGVKLQNNTVMNPVFPGGPLTVAWQASSAVSEAYVYIHTGSPVMLNPRGSGRPSNAQPPSLQHGAMRMIYGSAVYTMPVSISYTLNMTYTTIAETPVINPENLPYCASLGDYRPGGLPYLIMALGASGIYGVVMIVLLLSHYLMRRE